MKINGIQFPGLKVEYDPDWLDEEDANADRIPEFFVKCRCGWKTISDTDVEYDTIDAIRFHATHCPKAKGDPFSDDPTILGIDMEEIESMRFAETPLDQYSRVDLAAIVVWLAKDHPYTTATHEHPEETDRGE